MYLHPSGSDSRDGSRYRVLPHTCLLYTSDVAEQRGETLALGITALQKLRLQLFVDMRIVEYRFQITLDTCHRSLQLVSYILGKLPLQYRCV